ncbi:MAG: hypothetical protein IID44_26970 [Planctomycetes bacterium]|nr:hypothetical protein [Planctomycetota bacterium]
MMNDARNTHRTPLYTVKRDRKPRLREIALFLAVTLCLTPALIAMAAMLAAAASTAVAGR